MVDPAFAVAAKSSTSAAFRPQAVSTPFLSIYLLCSFTKRMIASDAIDNTSTTAPTATREGTLTQAGYKRLRASAACERCRVKKLKCNAARPSCSCCRQKQTPCRYAEPDLPASMQARGRTAEVEEDAASSFPHVLSETAPNSSSHPYKHLSTAKSMQRQGIDVPSGNDLLPYLDSFLANVHPISCNNFLHPGCLCEGLDDAPPLLLLSICASSSKFLTTPNAHEKGVQWASEATWLTMNSLDYASTLTVSGIQFLALHYVHLAQFTTASNLAGKCNLYPLAALCKSIHEKEAHNNRHRYPNGP